MNVRPCLPHKTFQHSIINVTVNSEGCLDCRALRQPYSSLVLKEEETIIHRTSSSSTNLILTLPEELPSVEDTLKSLGAGINDLTQQSLNKLRF